jgi:hypothetical protein
MDTKIYYLEDCKKTDDKIAKLTNFPCWIETDMIEMNYLRIEVSCRTEDGDAIDRIMNE